MLVIKQQVDNSSLFQEAPDGRRQSTRGLLLWWLCYFALFDLTPPTTYEDRRKPAEGPQQRLVGRLMLLEFTNLEWKPDFWMIYKSVVKMCWLVVGLMDPDKASDTPFPVFLHWFGGFAPRLHSISCRVFMVHGFHGWNYPSVTGWNFIVFRHFYSAWAFDSSLAY